MRLTKNPRVCDLKQTSYRTAELEKKRRRKYVEDYFLIIAVVTSLQFVSVTNSFILGKTILTGKAKSGRSVQ